MALHWYDAFCFAIVAAAVVASIWIIAVKERRAIVHNGRTAYESLLITVAAPSSDDNCSGAVQYSGSHFGSAQLWMSCWRGVHPAWLLLLRVVSFVTMAWTISLDMQIYDSSIMMYYTEKSKASFVNFSFPTRVGKGISFLRFNSVPDVGLLVLDFLKTIIRMWTFTLIIVYFAIATLFSAYGCWIYSQHNAENEEANGFHRCDAEANEFHRSDFEGNSSKTPTYSVKNKRNALKLQRCDEYKENEKTAGFWGYAMQIIYQTSAGAVMLTDVVFWCLLVPFLSTERFNLSLIMCCMHTFNAVFLLLDTALNNLPFPGFRMAYFVLWSSAYVIFLWVLHACGFSWWPYPFMELATPWAPLWYFCMALVHIPCYGSYFLIVKLKDSWFPKLFPRVYIRS